MKTNSEAEGRGPRLVSAVRHGSVTRVGCWVRVSYAYVEHLLVNMAPDVLWLRRQTIFTYVLDLTGVDPVGHVRVCCLFFFDR